MPSFDYDDMIYFSRYSLYGSHCFMADIERDLFRLSIGMIGSLMVLMTIYLAIRWHLLGDKVLAVMSNIGRMTFGIYVFQDLMLIIVGLAAKYMNSDYYWMNSFVSFVMIFLMAIFLTHTADKNRYLRFLFLGKIK